MAAVYHGVLCTVSDKWCASHTAHATANMMCTHGSAAQQARPSMCGISPAATAGRAPPVDPEPPLAHFSRNSSLALSMGRCMTLPSPKIFLAKGFITLFSHMVIVSGSTSTPGSSNGTSDPLLKVE